MLTLEFEESLPIAYHVNKLKETIALTDENSIFLSARSSLIIFLNENFIGPPLNDDIDLSNYFSNDHSIMDCDGEEFYRLSLMPCLLKYAVDSFAKLCESDYNYLWWYLQSLFIHQRCMKHPCASLLEKITSVIDKMEGMINEMSTKDQAIFSLQKGLIFLFFNDENTALKSFKEAQKVSGLKWAFTGKLGRRTKFQKFDITQLVIEASSDSLKHECFDRVRDKGVSEVTNNPQNLDLDDDTMLESIKLNEPVENSLNVFDQCLMMAFCHFQKQNRPGDDGLTKEQISAFLATVLGEKSKNWLVYSFALLMRSKNESDKSRTVERSALQVQALVDQFYDKNVEFCDRFSNFFNVLYPPIWEMKCELAQRFASIGVLRTALELFESLQMIDQVIDCYRMLEQIQKAEEILVEQLEKNPNNAQFWCILGDLRDDKSLYEKAWLVSGMKSSRSQRSLGKWFYRNNRYVECVEALSKALAINPLYENSWFLLGCAAMRIPEMETAVEAFQRVISIEPQNGEAYSNLAAIFNHMERPRDAFSCVKHSLKFSYENYRIWDNFLSLSLQLNEYNDAIIALDRLITMNASIQDLGLVKCLGILVHGVLMNSSSTQGAIQRTLDLTLKFTNTTSSSLPFSYAAVIYQSMGDIPNLIEFRKKAYRSAQTDEEKVKTAIQLCKDTLEFDIENINQCRMMLRSLSKKTEETGFDQEWYQELLLTLNKIQDECGK